MVLQVINKVFLHCGDFAQFNKLIEYSVKDLVNVNRRGGAHINDYKLLTNENYDAGFSNYIANGLAFAIFHDLAIYTLNFENEM